MSKIISENGILKITDENGKAKAVLFESAGKTVMVADTDVLHHEAGAALTQVGADRTLTNAAEGIDAGQRLFDLNDGFTDNIFWVFQGSTSGYSTGGITGPFGSPIVNVIDKFSFSSNSNATDVGDLTLARKDLAGQNSTTHGYASGGVAPGTPRSDVIDKFPFSVDGNATDVGNLTLNGRTKTAGQSSINNGYTSGGQSPAGGNYNDHIDKFPFSADGNATDVGDLTVGREMGRGQSSNTHGYYSGGLFSPPYTISNIIDKFPFSIDVNATDVGDLLGGALNGSGQSSDTHGYYSGGAIDQSPSLGIMKFSFASDGDAVDAADLAIIRRNHTGHSSTANGYTSGGTTEPPFTVTDVIQKFPFAADNNATDIADLTVSRFDLAGVQV